MKNFSKYGTILTRSEAKEIKGGGCDENDNYHGGDPEAGSGSSGVGVSHSSCRNNDCRGSCTVHSNGQLHGTCRDRGSGCLCYVSAP